VFAYLDHRSVDQRSVDMYDEYDDGDEGSSLGRKLALGVGVVAIAAAGFFAFKAVTKSDGGEASSGDSVLATDGTSAADSTLDPTVTTVAGTLSAGATTEPPTSEAPVTTEPAPTTAATTTTTAAATPTTPAPTTTAPVAQPPATYDTLPNGDPAWVIAIYGADSITLSGAVPDQAAKDRLESLAVGNAKEGQAATVVNNITLNPAVPRNVGARVVELTSARFPEGSAEILPAHAAELDRAVAIMTALPNITALVIGHADQRGNETANFAISAARADAVTTYMASRGIAPSRLSSRAVGEADLLTLNDDDAALELNRRTEFVFYGLLIG
jgi:outer membrane protein OmpA-like peptidoglycan-associated protein